MKRKPSSTHLSDHFYLIPYIKVDTIRLKFHKTSWLDKIPDGWNVRKTQHTRSRDKRGSFDAQGRPVSIMLTDEATGFRVGGDQYGAVWSEFSFPRFFNGDNTFLINSEKTFALAKDFVETKLAQVCKFKADAMEIIVTRLDLVQYVPIPLKDIIAAHRSCRHPKFHTNAAQYVGESLVFKGRFRQCRMYDSNLLKTGVAGQMTRVEWQLRSPTIARDFGYAVLWRNLSLEECYRVYRELCLGFDCSEVAAVDSIYHFLALAELNNWSHDGVPALELYLKSKKKGSTNRVRRKIASLRPTTFKFSWSDLLPATFIEFLKLNRLI